MLLGATCLPNFMGIGPGGPLHKWLKYNVLSLCTFPSLPFSFLSFLFLSSPTAKTAGRILSNNTSNAKDVVFGVRKFNFHI